MLYDCIILFYNSVPYMILAGDSTDIHAYILPAPPWDIYTYGRLSPMSILKRILRDSNAKRYTVRPQHMLPY